MHDIDHHADEQTGHHATDLELDEAAVSVAPSRGSAGINVSGLVVSAVGLVGWSGWLSWRVASLQMSLIAVTVLVLEIVAFSGALIVTAGLFAVRPAWRRNRRLSDTDRQLPVLLAEALDLGHVLHELDADADSSIEPTPGLTLRLTTRGPDDTGEIAWARRGIRVLGEQRRLDHRSRLATSNLSEATWSVVALDGLRRLLSVIALVVVLFTGVAPFALPPTSRVIMLAGGLALVSIGHWLLSGGHVRPASRTIWSMASIGAGLGDGISRSGLPIRWAMTMATLVVLNISVALRGMSDRWTHGLAAMDDTARVIAMSIAAGLVGVGALAMRSMPRPDLGHYGATRRLEETSVRHLALGLTLLVAAIGFIVGLPPVDVPISGP